MKEIFKRVSCRTYKNQKINDKTIMKLLSAAMNAPSALNQRAYRFIVIKNNEVKDKLSNVSAYSGFLKDAPLVVALIVDKTKIKSPNYVDLDLAMASENLMLEATHYKIASCFVGIRPNLSRSKYCNEVLNLSEEYDTFGLISLGYPLKKLKRLSSTDNSLVEFC